MSEFAEFIVRLKAGDAAARNELVTRYGGLVRDAVRRRLPDQLRREYDSLDFSHDVWASVLAIPADRIEFAGPEAFAGYLASVVRNKVIDAVRRRIGDRAHHIGATRPLDQCANVAGEEPTPSQWAIAGERWDELVASLPHHHRQVLERLRAGHSLAEISALTGVSVSTITRIVRRLKSLNDQ